MALLKPSNLAFFERFQQTPSANIIKGANELKSIMRLLVTYSTILISYHKTINREN